MSDAVIASWPPGPPAAIALAVVDRLRANEGLSAVFTTIDPADHPDVLFRDTLAPPALYVLVEGEDLTRSGSDQSADNQVVIRIETVFAARVNHAPGVAFARERVARQIFRVLAGPDGTGRLEAPAADGDETVCVAEWMRQLQRSRTRYNKDGNLVFTAQFAVYETTGNFREL